MKRKLTKEVWFEIDGKKRALYRIDGKLCYLTDGLEYKQLNSEKLELLKKEYFLKSFLSKKKIYNFIYDNEYIIDHKKDDKFLKDVNKLISLLFIKSNKDKVISRNDISSNNGDLFLDYSKVNCNVIKKDFAKQLKEITKNHRETIRKYKNISGNKISNTVINLIVDKKEINDFKDVIIENIDSIYNVYSDNVLIQLNKTINSSVKSIDKNVANNTEYKKEPSEEITREKRLEKYDIEKINESIQKYRLDLLFNVKNNDVKKISVVKEHYKNNVALQHEWENIDVYEKMCLKRIHNFFKRRALAFSNDDRRFFLGDFNSRDEFVNRYSTLLRRYLASNIINSELNKDMILTVDKQFFKAKNTLIQKLTQSVSDVQYTLAHNLYDSEINEELYKLIEDDFLSGSDANRLINNINLLVNDLNEKELFNKVKIKNIDLYLISRLRNCTHHFQDFENRKLYAEIVKLDDDFKGDYDWDNLSKELNKARVDYIGKIYVSQSLKHFDLDYLKYEDKTIFDYSSKLQLSRFDKVFNRIISELEISYDKQIDKHHAYKFILQTIYNGVFSKKLDTDFKDMIDNLFEAYEESDNSNYFTIRKGSAVVFNNSSQLADFYQTVRSIKNLNYNDFITLFKKGGNENSIVSTNKRIVDLLALLFIKYIESSSFSYLLDTKEVDNLCRDEESETQIDEFKKIINRYKLKLTAVEEPYLVFVSLAKILRIEQLNHLINDLTKYLQSINTINYNKEYSLFENENIDKAIEVANLENVVSILKEFLKLKNNEIEEDLLNNTEEKIKKVLRGYLPNNHSIESMYYNWDIYDINNNDNNNAKKYLFLEDNGNKLEKSKFIYWLYNYGDNNRFKRIHLSNYDGEKINIDDMLTEYGKYKSHQIDNTTKEVDHKRPTRIELISVEYQKELEKLKKVKSVDEFNVLYKSNELVNKRKEIVDFDYLENMLNLNIYMDGIKLSEELIARLVAFYFRFEQLLVSKYDGENKVNNDSIYKKLIKKRIVTNEGKAVLAVLLPHLNENEREDILISIYDCRLAINHYKNLKDLNDDDILFKKLSIYEMYYCSYYLLSCFDLKYKNAIKSVFINVCNKNNLDITSDLFIPSKRINSYNFNFLCETIDIKNNPVITNQYKNFYFDNGSKKQRVVTYNPSCDSEIISIPIISEEYTNYLSAFIFKRGDNDGN